MVVDNNEKKKRKHIKKTRGVILKKGDKQLYCE
jgi:hypothetical protein